jgi:hypothetical protein
MDMAGFLLGIGRARDQRRPKKDRIAMITTINPMR